MGRSKMESQEKHREPHFDTHHIVLKERKSATLTGVKEVLSFDSEEVQLDTIRGHLAIKGKGLHVRRLTLERGNQHYDVIVNYPMPGTNFKITLTIQI